MPIPQDDYNSKLGLRFGVGNSRIFYRTLGEAMRRDFGCNVWKVSVDAGFSCPNAGVDSNGNKRAGCIFCNINSFSPSRRLVTGKSIFAQIDEGIIQLKRHYPKAQKFIAYFQPSTNTNAPTKQLESLYKESLKHPEIVGLAIGTRPDSLTDETLDLLAEISQETYLQLEIGLQSIHRKSLEFLNRGHDYETFLDAYNRAKKRNIKIGVHLILGIPNENRNDVIETANEIAKLNPHSIKLHNLYVVRETQLADYWNNGNLKLPTIDEYAEMVVDFLERIPSEIIIDRISSEASAEYIIAPDWSKIKHAARNTINNLFLLRKSFQGKFVTVHGF
ncbi:MAG: TIGR01212 family radical SAM protein [Planctomycetaceae bacterium]|jgi:radical SAM protein (TIGR01212 family)|nr:TIGR01212 family radical SAM protein [Planctomycetaceae bacterium]